LEYRVVRKDGAITWLRHQGTLFHDEASGIRRVAGTLTDITGRKLALLALAESEQRFRQMADAAPMLVWTCDQHNAGDYFNRAWLDFTGRKLEEELGFGWTESVHPDDAEQLLTTCGSASKSRRPFRAEYRMRRHDGEYRWILEKGVPRFDADGIFLGFIGSAVDITDRKQAEETMMSYTAKLIQAQEEERRKIARELHDDVGQRLASLAIGLDNLRGKLSSTLRGGASRLWNQAEAISDRVRNISHDLHSPVLDLLGLPGALRALVEEFGQQYAIQVSFNEHDVPAQLPLDTKVTFYRVAQEALHNVTKHSHANAVSLDLEMKDGKLVLQVIDDGVGISREPRPDLGLGFASMQERLRVLGGNVQITSTPMGGTVLQASAPLR
jgi:PAS domain S-box-containing protein